MGKSKPLSWKQILSEFVRRFVSTRNQNDQKPEKKHKNKGTEEKSILKEIEEKSPYVEHSLTLEQLSDLHPLSRIDLTNPSKSLGLNDDEALMVLSENGKNIVTSRRCGFGHRVLMFWKQFLNTFRLLLLFTATVCLSIFLLDSERIKELVMAVALFIILLTLCFISFWEQSRLLSHINGFQRISPGECTVIREGRRMRIPSWAVVKGDLIRIRMGDRVPADCRLITSDEVRLETSWISGEVDSLDFVAETADKSFDVFDAQNVVFCGFSCTNGEALGVVIRTANNTLIGRLLETMNETTGKQSHLISEHERFVRLIALVAVSMSSLTFLFGLATNGTADLNGTFINGFLIVLLANVPQGLPVTVTALLIVVSRRLAKLGTFVKRVDVIDSLGLTSVLLCDKSRILTTGEKKVTDLWIDRDFADIHSETETLRSILEVLSVSDDSRLLSNQTVISLDKRFLRRRKSEKKRSMFSLEDAVRKQKSDIGKPTDSALGNFLFQKVNSEDLLESFDVVFELPFSANRRFHLSIVRRRPLTPSSDDFDGLASFRLMVKGAPEELIQNCSQIRLSNETVPLDSEILSDFEKAYEKFASEGKSCIGCAVLDFEDLGVSNFVGSRGEPLFPETDWVFLGMMALSDSPICGIGKPIRELEEAGIRLFIVTGDNPMTAKAIADRCEFGDSAVIHGDHLSALTESQWDQIFSQKRIIFARTTPNQKSEIIAKCQQRNLIVTLTGDGLMDAKALREADCGVATDILSSAFATEAADAIAVRTALSKIVETIAESRLLFDNLRKTIAYVLSHLLPELCSVLLFFVFGIPIGLNSLQVLSVDLITEIPPSVALALFEKAESDIMQREPRRPDARLVTFPLLFYSYGLVGFLISLGCLLSYFSVFWSYGFMPSDILHSASNHWTLNSLNISTNSGEIIESREQWRIHEEAAASWQICLVGSQMFNLLSCSTRRMSLLGSRLFANPMIYFSMIIQISVLAVLLFVEPISGIVGIRPPPLFVFLFPITVGVLIILINELRKFHIRRNGFRFLNW